MLCTSSGTPQGAEGAALVGKSLPRQARREHQRARCDQRRGADSYAADGAGEVTANTYVSTSYLTVNVDGVSVPTSELSLTHRLNGPGSTTNWP